jgi:uncharacterized membrane protein (DUF4010 family)
MHLLVAYLACLLVTQSAAIGLGLLVDKVYSPHAGLVVFLILYFLMFWVGWQIAVRITEPRSSSDAPTMAS